MAGGLDSRFGLYKVDFETLQRKQTQAAAYYSYIIKSRANMNLSREKISLPVNRMLQE